MTGPTSRSGRLVAPAQSAFVAHTPHAALLIDFDNVTMGIRSDLTKELKQLLNSEIIRGKVTVQRAYADWRRYPQYVMPLTERSIDMIWATAVGSTKKNATDIRLAIDAIELVFTRPEIGTYIILSGDSDFSSLVLKLKEYGKYVVGIGIRESASDLLIQNCDEYYSYSELAGLNREVDAPTTQRDPWELVREAVGLMVRNDDVMRSDRLKQVMQQLDPNFDERNAGFNRFSKFVTEAGSKGLLTLTKLDNGQYEVGPVAAAPAGRPSRQDAPPADEGRRGRGRRGRDRGDRPERDRDRSRQEARQEPKPEARVPERQPSKRADAELTLGAAFRLMSQALGEIPNPAPHDLLRARMAALLGREDPLLDPERFERLLRQANDAEIAEVKRAGEGYEVSLSRVERVKAAESGAGRAPTQPAEQGEPAAAADSSNGDGGRTATLRFRRGSRAPLRPSGIPLVGVVDADTPAADAAPVASTTADDVQDADSTVTKGETAPAKPAAGKKGVGTRSRGRKKAAAGKVAEKAAPASAEERSAAADKPAKPPRKKRTVKRAPKKDPA